MKSRWAKLVLLVLFACMSMGGSFTCFASSDHDDDHHHDHSKSKSK